MEDLIQCGDFTALEKYCEDVELQAPNGIAQPQTYGCLLASYLLHNEMDYAKLLWERIAPEIKQNNKELSALWDLGKKLWKHKFSDVYGLVEAFSWPEYIKPLITSIVDITRSRMFLLISHSYNKIRLEDVASLTGLSGTDLQQAIGAKGWTMDTTNTICSPKTADPTDVQQILSQEKLVKLTNIVSFLEN